MVPIFTDSDVAAFPMEEAVQCMRGAFRQLNDGQLVAPHRMLANVGIGQLVFTAGSSASEEVTGFRFYDLQQLESEERGELTAVFSSKDGRMIGLVTGKLLGATRTGAIGGVAIENLEPPASHELALIGTGLQATTQLRAVTSLRSYDAIRVYSRDEVRRERFCEAQSRELDADLRPVSSVEEAVSDADIVICATTSDAPIVDSSAFKENVHISTIGPKFLRSHELAADIYESCTTIVTDSPAQLEAFGEDMLVFHANHNMPIEPLSRFVVGDAQRAVAGRSVFISLGLAGTEVLLANRMLRRNDGV